jgi:putative transposase
LDFFIGLSLRQNPARKVQLRSVYTAGKLTLSQAFVNWCKDQGIEFRFFQPGKPEQSAFIERFSHSCRNKILDAHLFDSISQVQEITDDWLRR